MKRISIVKIQQVKDGRLINGFDYKNKAWVKNGKYVKFFHHKSIACSCFGKVHEGEKTLPEVTK